MDGLSAMLNLVNYVFVLIFGIVVSFYFADITWEDNKKTIISTLVAFALLQAVCYVLLGERILYKSYPFIIHIPLILVIRYVCHKNIYISTIAVLSAYLMCTPRKWFGTVAAYIIKDIHMISDIVTIIITIPLLFIVIKYISPYIIKLENESKTILSIFFFLPLTYYVSEYAFTVYTDLCSLLANALENAINACKLVQPAPAAINSNRIITVKVFDKNNKLCINITNTYAVEPVFVNNTPVSDKAGHGIGIRSIISVIEKYNGVYDFFTEDGVFYFQACI